VNTAIGELKGENLRWKNIALITALKKFMNTAKTKRRTFLPVVFLMKQNRNGLKKMNTQFWTKYYKIKGDIMLKHLSIVTTLASILSACGTEERTAPTAPPPVREITPPQPQQYENRLECWVELICISPNNSCDPASWREVEVCHTVKVPVGI